MISNRKFLALALLTASPLSLIAGATPAAAQERAYDIKAQALSNAIVEYSRQSNVAVLAPMELVEGKKSKAVRGSFSASEALDRLLAGSGLRAVRGANGGMSLVRATGGANLGGRPRASAVKGQATLVGQVVDEATGRRLPGAIVRVVETGDTAISDGQGQFRFGGLAPGSIQISTSFIGYPENVQNVAIGSDGQANVNVALTRTDEIVVYGMRSARSLALSKERTADNSQTVISSDLLGNFQGTTISEALRKAPGVSFIQDDRTGDGTNIIVRGLSPDYNQVALNGITLPDVTGGGRAANLGSILADSVSEIKISKTLLPSQDGAGTGGLVEIETKSPLDRPRRYASFGLEGSKRGGGYSDDHLATGAISGRFGSGDNFGATFAVQYRERTSKNYNYQSSVFPGPYLPIGSNGRPIDLSEIDPRTPYPFDGSNELYVASLSSGISQTRTKTLGLNAAFEWQVDDATNLRLDYIRNDQKADNLSASIALSSSAWYSILPVSSLGGEERYTLNDPLDVGLNMTAGYSTGERQITDTLSFRGETKMDRWQISYRAGLSSGRSKTPAESAIAFSLPQTSLSAPGLLLPEATDSQTGYVTTFFGPRRGTAFPLPLLTQTGFEQINSPTANRLEYVSIGLDSRGKNWNRTAGLDVRYDVGSFLDYVKIGASYNRSRFSYRVSDTDYYSGILDENFLPPSASGFGIDFEDIDFGRLGDSAGSLQLPSFSSIRNLLNNIDATVSNGLTNYERVITSPLNGLSYTNEETLSAYLESRFKYKSFEIIGGFRLNRVDLNAGIASQALYTSPTGVFDEAFATANRKIINAEASQTDWLPRILINFRPEENIVVRVGYYSTVARPQVGLLSGEQSVVLLARPRYGPNRNQPRLTVSSGNPNLKSAVSRNFDFSAEIYNKNVGVIKAGIFYKRINNLLERTRVELTDLTGIQLPDDPRFTNLPPNILIEATRPINNPDVATIWGVELAVERQFDFLPGALSGLGVYANYTYTKSKKNEPRIGSAPVYDDEGNLIDFENFEYTLKGISFDQSPRHSGTASLTYSKSGINAAVSYSYQARRKILVSDYSLWQFQEAVDTLDVRGEYRFNLDGRDVRIYAEATDLLKGSRDADTQISVGGLGDVPKTYTGGYFRGGRNFVVGFGITF